MFVIYVFVAGGNDGPVYGDRCASLIAIDKVNLQELKMQSKQTQALIVSILK
ncbi:MAG: hypothetical protein ACLRQF_09260 [Thomasclavelia ramosa]